MTIRRQHRLQSPIYLLVALLLAVLPFLEMAHSVAAQEDATAEVRIIDFAFNPVILRIASGTTVTWTNVGNTPHTVTADDGTFDSGRIQPGAQFSHTFDQPGTFTHFCAIHPQMQATVVVSADGAEPGDESTAAPSASAPDGQLLAMAQASGLPAALHEGDCASVGAVITSIANASVPAGDPVGNREGLPAANSFTTVPLSLAAILGSDHAIVVTHPTDSDVIACGEVGGYLADAGSVAIGLSSESDSDVSGIAFLSPGSDGISTGISLFLAVPGELGQAAPPSEPTPLPVAEPPATEQPAAASQIDSGGLGLPIEAFYARYGEAVPDPVMYGEVIMTSNGRIRVGAAGNDKVNSVTRYFDQGVAFEDARSTGLGFAPADSVLVQTYTTSVGSTVDLYYSPALATQFSETHTIDGMEFPTWVEGEPGQFIIDYGGYNPANGVNEVTRIVMALGNNP